MDAMTAWTTVMGNRTPAAVVRDFDLSADRRSLDQWLGEAESEACLQAPEKDEDGLLGREALAAALAPHHERFLDDLETAAREAEAQK